MVKYWFLKLNYWFFFRLLNEKNDERTYALTVTSNKMAAIGIINSPSQNTGDVYNSVSMPANTAAIGTVGQKLLQKKISKWKSVQMEKI